MLHPTQNDYHFHLYQAIGTGNKVTALHLINNSVTINFALNGYTPLHWAIYKNADFDIIKLLLDKGANIYATNHQNYTPLRIAIDYHRIAATVILIQRGALVGENLPLLLVKPAVQNNPTLIKMLIDYGMQYEPSISLQCRLSVIYSEGGPEIINKYIPEILVTGSGYQHRECIKTLLKWNFTINPSSHRNENFIYSAVEKGYSPIVSQLLELGINVNMVNPHTGLNLLTVACLHRYDEIVENLLKHNANVNAIIPYETWILINQSYFNNSIYDVNVLFPSNHSWNMTCLHIAVFNSDLVITKILLRYGAKILKDPTFINITSFAAQNNYSEIVRMFLEHAWSRDNGINMDGDSLLHEMIKNKFDPEYIKMLLNLNFPVDILNRNGLTPLLLACKTYSANQLKTIEVLLQYNADVNSRDYEYMTPLHIVCEDENRKQLQTFPENGVDNFDTNSEDQIRDSVYELNTKKKIQLLLKHNANIEVENMRRERPLLTACRSENITAVKCLLENRANSNATYWDRETALHLICTWNLEKTLQIIQLLLKHNANIEVENMRRERPLLTACRSENITAVKCLLENRANSNATYWDRETALHLVCTWNLEKTLQIIQLLLKHNANVEAQNWTGFTPLHKACESVNIVAVKCLLENHANPNIADRYGQTALHRICFRKSRPTLQIIQLLLKHNADINAVNRRGETPLFKACDSEDIVAVKCLLENHANPNIADRNGQTALHIICFRKSRPTLQIIQLLIKHNADIEAVDDKGRTPLFEASNSENIVAVECLLENHANPNIADRNGQTALHRICSWKFKTTREIIQLLLQSYADINTVNRKGETPLFEASNSENIVAVECLLENHANPNIPDRNGQTALHRICLRKSRTTLQIIQLLIKHNADIEAVDDEGRTPLFIACIHVNNVTVQGLLRYGANVDILDKRNQSPLQCAVDRILPYIPLSSYISATFETLVSQIIKLKTAGLDVNACEFITINGVKYSAIEGLKSIAVIDDTIDTLDIKCEEEIERMKMESIGINDMFFYDLLTQHIHFLGILMENEKIQQILKPSIYDEKFPLYVDIIRFRLRDAQIRYRRYKLKKSAREYFSSNINQELPHECIDKVLDYLTIVDLKTFIRTFETSRRE